MGCCQSETLEDNKDLLKKYSYQNQFKMRAMIVDAKTQEDYQDITKMIQSGFQVNTRMPNFQFTTILHVAAQFGELRLVSFLVEEHRCKVNVRNSIGATPIFYAMQRGKFDIVKYLLSKRAKVNYQTKFFQKIDEYLPDDRRLQREALQLLKRYGFKSKKEGNHEN